MVDDVVAAVRGRGVSLLLCAATVMACGGDDTQVTGEESSSSGAESSSTSPATTTTSAESSSTEPSTTMSTTEADTTAESSSTAESSGTTTSESSSSSEESSSGAIVEESSESGTPAPECPVADLDPDSTDPVFGNTLGRDDDFTGSCGGDGSPDVGYTFTAPADGTYTFDTSNSQLDTVLYLLDGTCSGTELACNDDGDGSRSVITIDLLAGQTVTAIVDGNAPTGDPFSLRVRAGTFVCPAGDAGSASPTEFVGDSTTAYNTVGSNCGGFGGPEDGWLFTAPVTATYTIDTFGSSFESVVHVRDGVCGGAELACGEQGSLVPLTAGQQVTIYVDSTAQGGAYEVHIDTLGGACPDQDLGNVPQSVVGDTSDGDNTDSGSCGGDFSPDDLYAFTAPNDAFYTFDTFGSAIDTVLFVRQGGCGGPELACNDDLNQMTDESRILLNMSAGQEVLVGVDGNAIGSYTLNIEEVPCPGIDLGSVVPQTVVGDTSGGFNLLEGSCDFEGPPNFHSPDVAYSFTAPEDGEYTFDTSGSFFDTVLYVLDGPACNAPEIVCSDNFAFQQTSALSLALSAGETITVVVDGNFNGSGPFTLNVGQLGDGVCPDGDLGNTVPQTFDGDTSDGDNTLAASCGGFTQPDDTYLFTAEIDGLYVFDTFGSVYDTVLYLRDGGCDGDELACSDDYNFNPQSLVSAQLAAGQTVMVGVDGNFEAGSYSLNVQYVTCPDEDIDSDLPADVAGATLAAVDKLDSPDEACPDDGSPDYAIEWTAPADGTYDFDLSGSDYDTVLYLQEAACGGDQIACNDDNFGVQSFLSVDLVEGQTIIIVVSGYFGSSGNFTLAID